MLKPAAAFLGLALVACETLPPENTTMPVPSPSARLLPVREATYHLSSEDRTRISKWLDADALEEVIAWLKPEYRGEVLEGIRILANTNTASVHVIPISENDPEWIGAPDALKMAVRRLSKPPARRNFDSPEYPR